MSSRRGNGEGTIYRRKDGRWEAGYWREVDGVKKRKSIYGKTRQEVATKLRAAQQQVAAGIVPPAERTTVANYLQTGRNP